MSSSRSTVYDVVRDLTSRGVRFRAEDGRLVVSPPGGGLLPHEVELIRAHRDELLALLSDAAVPAETSGAIPRLGADELRQPAAGQERLWVLTKLENMGSAYNQGILLRLKGRLDASALEKAWGRVVERHEVLRSRYPEVDGRMGLEVGSGDEARIAFEDVGALGEGAGVEALERARTFLRAPFDLEAGPLWRVGLWRTRESEHVLAIGIHHIISDAWSLDILQSELAALYREVVTGTRAELPELTVSYFDYAAWQRRRLEDPDGAPSRHVAYWRSELEGIQPLELPTRGARPAVQSHDGDVVSFTISPELVRTLESVAQREGATLFQAALGVFQLLMARYADQNDVAVGIPEAGRKQAEVEPLLGYFINTLAIRTRFEDQTSFRDLLGQMKKKVLDAIAHAEAPFDRVVNEVEARRDMSRSPVFQVMFSFPRIEEKSPALEGLEVEVEPLDQHASMFDMTMWVSERQGRLSCDLEYNTALFERRFVEECAASYVALLERVVETPEVPVLRLPLVTGPREKEMVAGRAGVTDARLPDGAFLEWVRARVEGAPERIAVEDHEGTRWTYSDLWERSARVASALRARGVGRGALVGVHMSRGADVLAILLGISRAGAAYVPLDPAFPEERLRYVAGDAGLVLVVTETGGELGEAPQLNPSTLLDEPANGLGEWSDPSSDDLAYVLYTSGSTGRPKGVEVTHGALRNFLGSMRDEPGLEPDDVLAAVTTLSFDISGLELYLPLIVGARVVLVDSETAGDAFSLNERLTASGATVMQATPATWRMLLDAGWKGGLKKALCGGEALPEELAGALVERAAEVWNLYGPTETTIWSTLDRVKKQEPVTVGRPIANTRVYVLDSRGNLVPDGVYGEIWIAGSGVARGYRNRPDLTDERFRPDPFVPGERMYRTGDQGRWRRDGRLEHLGRLDFQVKVHGFRIELGEIEAALEALPEVRQAVVTVRGEADDRRLVAYVVFAPGEELLAGQIRSRLSTQLPQYMVPGIVVPLDAFPLTPNGKVDRKALPDPLQRAATAAAPTFERPEGLLEETLAGVWQELLAVERVGRHDNFFELGGHSLLVFRVATEMRRRAGVELEPRALFFRTLAQVVAGAETVDSGQSESRVTSGTRG